MKEKYVIYYRNDDSEVIVKMTKEQAKAINWFIDKYNIDAVIDTIEDYPVEEI